MSKFKRTTILTYVKLCQLKSIRFPLLLNGNVWFQIAEIKSVVQFDVTCFNNLSELQLFTQAFVPMDTRF